MKKILSAVFAILLVSSAIAADLGEDGMHTASWLRNTFKDLSEDLAEANADGKRFVVIVEQRGCSYCKKMHEEVFSDAVVLNYLEDNFFVIRINLHGDTDVTDFDGEVLSEKAATRKWGLLFTPTMLFLPESVDENTTAAQAAVAAMPGAFSVGTTLDLLTWVNEERYAIQDETGEDFQRYHARKISERQG